MAHHKILTRVITLIEQTTGWLNLDSRPGSIIFQAFLPSALVIPWSRPSLEAQAAAEGAVLRSTSDTGNSAASESSLRTDIVRNGDDIGSPHILLGVLEDRYEALVARLAKRLGSADRAKEALHDVYLKLWTYPYLDVIKNPTAYLYRMALNFSENVRIRNMRYLPLVESEAAAVSDDRPGPEQIVAGRHDLALAIAALDTLSAQRKAIFLARWRDGKSHMEIAQDFGLHKRTVQKELAKAEDHLRNAKR